MKKWLLCCCLLLALPLAAQAEDEKIDPANYICAEFVAQGAVSQDPPVFQALQIDGYVSSNIGYTVADPQAINVLVPQAYLMCQEQPTAVVAEIWEPLKKKLPRPISGEWEADVTKCRIYLKNFREFFLDQIQSAETIILSRTQTAGEDRIEKAVALLRENNERARIITTPWDDLDAKKMLDTIETPDFLLTIDELFDDDDEHEHHHHHHDHDGECCCGHHHHDDDDDDEHEHHHHDGECCGHHHHDDDDDEHEHHHHHDHDEHDHECGCGHHHHHDHECGCGHHHHGHDADEVFQNIGVETPKKFEESAVREALEALDDEHRFGSILRAKGILPLTDGSWLHFDYVPGEYDLRHGPADYTGRMCIIGVNINEPALKELFGI